MPLRCIYGRKASQRHETRVRRMGRIKVINSAVRDTPRMRRQKPVRWLLACISGNSEVIVGSSKRSVSDVVQGGCIWRLLESASVHL